jgi:hypothetical protein
LFKDWDQAFDQDFDACPMPRRELTEEESLILEMLGPPPKLDFDISTPPGDCQRYTYI